MEAEKVDRADGLRLPAQGDVLAGKYRIERVLGRGGMGVVLAAQHVVLGQRVAVKMLLAEHAQRADALQRFLNEARAAAHIESDHVARVMDIGTAEDGTPFMVLEYLDGIDLAQLARARSIPRVDVVDYVLQALEGIAQAHTLGIVHRDLKPANLFYARKPDGTSRIKVLDFGISKTDGVMVAPSGITSATTILGSPYYMSPEQLRSAKQVDTRTDVWAIGVILYELLSGRMPFSGESVAEVFTAILEQTPATIQSADVPEALEAVVFRCFGRPAENRYSDVGALALALGPFGSAGGAASALRVRLALEEGARRAIAKRDEEANAPPASPAPLPASTLALPRAPASRAPVDPERTIADPAVSPSISERPAGQTSSAWGHASRHAPAPVSVRSGPRGRAIAIAVVLGMLAIAGGGALVARTSGSSVAPQASAGSAGPINEPAASGTRAPLPALPSAAMVDPLNAVVDAAVSAPTSTVDAGVREASSPVPSARVSAPPSRPPPAPKPTYDPLHDSRR